MKRWMLVLVICIPLTSVMFGSVMLYFAVTSDDVDLLSETKPLSKTSWKATQEESIQEESIQEETTHETRP